MSIVEKDPNSSKLTSYTIRPMEAWDVAAVTAIEREAFPTTWPPTPFRRELSNRLARYLVACEFVEEEPEPPAPLASELAATPPRTPLIGRFLRALGQRLSGQERDLKAPTEPILGYVGIWIMVDEAHITAVATREAYRSLGIGALLLIGTLELAMRQGCRIMTLEVRASNQVAQALYRRFGFKETGLRKRYYNDNGEDALLMTTDRISSPEYQALFEHLVEAHERRWGHTDRVLF